MSLIQAMPLKMRRGDYKSYIIKLRSVREFMSVTKIEFNSCGLDIKKDFKKSISRQFFYIEFTPEETELYKLGDYTFDITITYEGLKPQTQSGMPIKISKKINTGGCCNE